MFDSRPKFLNSSGGCELVSVGPQTPKFLLNLEKQPPMRHGQ